MFMKSFLSVIQGESEVPEIRSLWKEAMTQRPPWPAFIADAAALLARQSANLGDWDHVREVVATVSANPIFGRSPMIRVPPQGLQARLALHDGDAQGAWDLLQPLLADVDKADHHGDADFTRVTMSAAACRLGRFEEAWTVMLPLLEAVRDSGNLGRLVLAGKALVEEIALVPWPAAIARDSRLALLRGWMHQVTEEAVPMEAGAAQAVPMPAALTATSLPSAHSKGITEREMEVLALVARGESNKLIARRLELSPNTVKRHMARILDRLQVSSRGQAARWYYDQTGMLPVQQDEDNDG
jgi:LuxR family maltose regulon positive regulatory protein